MRSVIQEVTVSEFDLLTLAAEIERILNSRPITHLPDSHGCPQGGQEGALAPP